MNPHKRSYDARGLGHPHKKPRFDDRNGRELDSQHHNPQRQEPLQSRPSHSKPQPTISHADALAQLPAPTTHLGPIPHYTPFTTSAGLPPLPTVQADENLSAAPFRHKSSTSHYHRSSTAHSTDVTYEKLEFLGDAYLELFASRLLYTRFPHLLAGQQSQLRELLVKNETLAGYARAYGFETRVLVGDLERMQADAKERGNKGFNKVLGDVFEAYVAAVVLSDAEHGFAVAEKWMQALWAPKLLEAARQERYLTPSLQLQHPADEAGEGRAAAVDVYDPTAKAELQKRILGGGGTKLEYETYQASVELKGDQLGQNRHFIAVYLTGYGYERKLLGKGEGKNKVEAGNWAATRAMWGEEAGVVRECEGKLREIKEAKRMEREVREVEAGEMVKDGEGK